ncbi:MAG: ribosome assembly RNA-binding protein YhbY [Pseudomonadales bacterium]|nr:ribosome assembly RNA-binding protein YhbY [Pseudomonadales bacterium]
MTLSNQQKKRLRSIGHQLKPTAIVSDQGLNEGVLKEINLRLEDHELIKIKIHLLEKKDRTELAEKICQHCKAELVQFIGKIALLYRPAKQPSPRLSNLLRNQNAGK